ncbi:AP-4 complex subunit mu-1-like [Branchiostoma floridae]|uniref:AP-4 complex subunit mu-1-like n=1 Tax=Branchiostoma floridae TaxID=7739 RepID=A0A9J7LGW6_BRAFL|nr:AP-4 complex subunit mu-1-like [Branchiostoma floridae]
MISQFVILSQHGDILLFKDYRGDVGKESPELFLQKIRDLSGGLAPPTFHHDGIHYIHVKHSSLCFMATTRSNVSPFMVIELINRVASLCKDYCGVLSEEAIRLNFPLVYEILDEVIDFGYPQGTSTDMLKAYMENSPVLVREGTTPGLFGAERRMVPSTAANKSIMGTAVSQGRKNEIFVDVLERLTVLISTSGSVLRADIDGIIQMKSFLVGIPEIKMGLSEDLTVGKEDKRGYHSHAHVDECSFHESVDLSEFGQSRVLTIHPPQGEFPLMKYQASGDLPSLLPFRLFPTVNDQDSSRDMELVLKLRCDVPSTSHAVNVMVRVPVPKATTSVSQQLSGPGQSVEFKAQEHLVVWSIKKFPGATELTARFKLAVANRTPSSRLELGPVSLNFELPMYICSRLQIRFLRLFDHEQSYVPYRWVRYVTHSDSYVIRI